LAEIVVADAGPLIALGRLGRIELLPRIFAKIIVPQIVFEETQFYPDLADARAILASRQAGVFMVDSTLTGLAGIPPDEDLDAGEAAAISIAASRGFGILIDDMHGRTVATTLNLSVIGTVGVLIMARQRGMIPLVTPLLEDLVASGYRLSTELVRSALRQVGE